MTAAAALSSHTHTHRFSGKRRNMIVSKDIIESFFFCFISLRVRSLCVCLCVSVCARTCALFAYCCVIVDLIVYNRDEKG